ncbi:MAG: ABC transporter substrate-binding protein [Pseudorhodoplanes sp.]
MTSLELINALTGGHFQSEGLKVQLEAGNSGTAALQQLLAGRCEIARVHAIDLFKAYARQKAPIVAIANLEHDVNYMIASSKERPVASAAELRGKRVGVFTVGSTADNYLELLLRKAGVPSDQVERQQIPISPAAFVHVSQGRLDALVLTHEIVLALEQAKEPIHAWSLAPYFRMPGRSYVTRRDVLKERPELLLAFVRGMVASVREIAKGPIDPIVERATSGYTMPTFKTKELTDAVVASNVAHWLDRGPNNILRNIPEDWQDARLELTSSGLAPIPADVQLFTNEMIDQALAK